jgi:cytochrome c oxidase subunit IV
MKNTEQQAENKTAMQANQRTGMETHIVSYRIYCSVWIALLALLGITIAAAKLYYSKYSVLINLLIASIKAFLVLIFFMHLKYEGRFLKGLVFITIAVLTSIIALTFSDVWFR